MEMIRGTKRPLKIAPKIRAELHNRFDIEVKDAHTGEIKTRAFAENLITNQLWERLALPASYFSYIHIGTGTGVAAVSNTELFNFLVAKPATDRTVEWQLSNYVSVRKQIQLLETENVGAFLREVGIGFSNAQNSLVTHALLKDMNGNPISIQKTSLDIITIYATVFIEWLTSYDNETIEVFNQSSNLWLPNYLGGEGGGLLSSLVCADREPLNGALGSNDFFLYPGTSYQTDITCVYASKKITLNALRIPASAGNTVPFRTLGIYHIYNISSGWTPNLRAAAVLTFRVAGGSWFPGSEITGEDIGTGDGTATVFKTHWPFVGPGIKVYVDGLEKTSGVTVQTLAPDSSKYADVGRYFQLIEADAPAAGYNLPNIGFNLTDSVAAAAGNYGVYFNPASTYGVAGMTLRPKRKLEAATLWVGSSTMWQEVAVNNGTGDMAVTVPSALQHLPYWRLTALEGGVAGGAQAVVSADMNPGGNIIFDVPPAQGAVITADYFSQCVAKDDNHVFDFSFEITLEERPA
jgi:hypothetical protein